MDLPAGPTVEDAAHDHFWNMREMADKNDELACSWPARARNLMVLAVPKKNADEFEDELLACGFKKAGS
jgi:hypothetical protein